MPDQQPESAQYWPVGASWTGFVCFLKNTIKKAIQEQHHAIDLALGIDIRYGLGFGLNQKELRYPNPNTIYWGGVGGSWLVMDLDARLCFCYAMNKMVNNSVKDPRTVKLKRALFSAL